MPLKLNVWNCLYKDTKVICLKQSTQGHFSEISKWSKTATEVKYLELSTKGHLSYLTGTVHTRPLKLTAFNCPLKATKVKCLERSTQSHSI